MSVRKTTDIFRCSGLAHKELDNQHHRGRRKFRRSNDLLVQFIGNHFILKEARDKQKFFPGDVFDISSTY